MHSPHYAVQDSPNNHKFHAPPSNGARPLNVLEKVFEVTHVLSYFFGSLLFLLGSIYFYPKYSILWGGKGGEFGSWAFMFGCVCFWVGANIDFFNIIRFTTGSTLWRFAKAYNGLLYYMAASIFILGAIYFLPEWYPKGPSIGCYSFIVGSILFCLAALIDIVFITITHEDPAVSGIKLSNLKCWGTIAALGTFIGALLFIIGSWFYLPRFIGQEDADAATAYMYKSINYYVVGSVFFLINSFALVPDMIASFKASNGSSGSLCKV